MRTSKILRIGLIAAAASAGGCAPVAFAGGTGFGVSVGPSLRPSLSSCALLGHSSLAARLGLTSPSISIAELRNRVASLQAEYSLSANAPGARMQSWKQAATGECY